MLPSLILSLVKDAIRAVWFPVFVESDTQSEVDEVEWSER